MLQGRHGTSQRAAAFLGDESHVIPYSLSEGDEWEDGRVVEDADGGQHPEADGEVLDVGDVDLLAGLALVAPQDDLGALVEVPHDDGEHQREHRGRAGCSSDTAHRPLVRRTTLPAAPTEHKLLSVPEKKLTKSCQNHLMRKYEI